METAKQHAQDEQCISQKTGKLKNLVVSIAHSSERHEHHHFKLFSKVRVSLPDSIAIPRGLALCPALTDELRNTAIKRIGADIMNCVVALKLKKLIDARNRVDVPFGMFGFSKADFEVRRDIADTLYMDILEMMQPETLEDIKNCIVLDNIQQFIERLLSAYETKQMTEVLKEFSDATDVLCYQKFISDKYKKNSADLQRLRLKLQYFRKKGRERIDNINIAVYKAMNECAEFERLNSPIEMRYQRKSQEYQIYQLQLKMDMAEEKLSEKLKLKDFYLEREQLSSNLMRTKLKTEIAALKKQLVEFDYRYDIESDRLDGDIIVLKKHLYILRDRAHNKQVEKEEFELGIVEIQEWEREREEIERHKEQLALIAEEKKRRRKELRLQRLAAKQLIA